MARYYGITHANRGMATRCGSRSITTSAQTWGYAIKTTIWKIGKSDDMFEVAIRNTAGESRSLFKGTQEDVERFIDEGVLPREMRRRDDD